MRSTSAIALAALVVLFIMFPCRAAPKDTPGQRPQSAPNAVVKDAAGSAGDTPYEGIGISPKAIAIDNQSRPVGPLRIAEVYTGTPAEAAGLEVDDTIIAINGRSTKGARFDTLVGLIRGPAGTSVRLTVKRAGTTTATEYTVMRRQMVQREFGGIGAELKARTGSDPHQLIGPVTVIKVFSNTPAEKGGLRVGDTILAVDGIPIGGMPFDSIIAHIRGEVGTSVALQVTYAGARKSIMKTLTREKITTAQTVPADTVKAPR